VAKKHPALTLAPLRPFQPSKQEARAWRVPNVWLILVYLREPSIITHVAFEGAKTAEAVALEILDAEVSWLASTRATTVIGLKLKAYYAPTVGKLADSIVEDILQL
jgi:hypothetical protein